MYIDFIDDNDDDNNPGTYLEVTQIVLLTVSEMGNSSKSNQVAVCIWLQIDNYVSADQLYCIDYSKKCCDNKKLYKGFSYHFIIIMYS